MSSDKEEKGLDQLEKDLSAKKPAPDPEPPIEHVIIYTGPVISDRNAVHSKVVPSKQGGLECIVFDRIVGIHEHCAIVADPDVRSRVCIDVRPNPRDKKKRMLVWFRDYRLLAGMDPEKNLRPMFDKRRRQLQKDNVPDMMYLDIAGKDVEEV